MYHMKQLGFRPILSSSRNLCTPDLLSKVSEYFILFKNTINQHLHKYALFYFLTASVLKKYVMFRGMKRGVTLVASCTQCPYSYSRIRVCLQFGHSFLFTFLCKDEESIGTLYLSFQIVMRLNMSSA